ncbi:MAG TPA: HEAT repeat domain-containing protein [Kofleriaceae bacterium]|nr:HEAT repeat domain-containing protein [Kofleriaceae bacterium]
MRPGNAIAIAALCLGSAIALAAEPPAGDPDVVAELSGIDYVPTKSSLDDLFEGAAAVDLIELAEDETDPGVKMRALRALALYPGAETAAALRAAIAEHGDESTGTPTLMTRLAALSLAKVEGADAVPDLADLIDHPSRDVRASVAEALAVTESPDAIPILRDRLAEEPIEQVRLKIADALRKLDP